MSPDQFIRGLARRVRWEIEQLEHALLGTYKLLERFGFVNGVSVNNQKPWFVNANHQALEKLDKYVFSIES